MNKKKILKESVILEWDEHFHALRRGQYAAAWVHLERAHILAQKMPVLHTLSHLKMLKLAIRQRNVQEVLGQVHRLVLAWPGSMLGILPTGNVGSARVSAFVKMEIPRDLREILDKT